MEFVGRQGAGGVARVGRMMDIFRPGVAGGILRAGEVEGLEGRMVE